jgi:hypothetical protein
MQNSILLLIVLLLSVLTRCWLLGGILLIFLLVYLYEFINSREPVPYDTKRTFYSPS